MSDQAHITFPIDHFGIVSANLFAQLLNQSGDKRKRKTAFNAIRTMCKQFAMLPKDAEVETISLSVDAAGQIAYRVDYTSVRPHDRVIRSPSDGDGCLNCNTSLFGCVEMQKAKQINCCAHCTHEARLDK